MKDLNTLEEIIQGFIQGFISIRCAALIWWCIMTEKFGLDYEWNSLQEQLISFYSEINDDSGYINHLIDFYLATGEGPIWFVERFDLSKV